MLFGGRKKTAKFGRDYITVDAVKTGPEASLQKALKKDPTRGLVEFRNIPKLKYIKDTDPKYTHVWIYRVRQCSYLFNFPTEEKELLKLLSITEMASGDGAMLDMGFITMHKKKRKEERLAMNKETSLLLHKTKSPNGAKGLGQHKEKLKKKKTAKLRSKDPEMNAKFLKSEVLLQIQQYLTVATLYEPQLSSVMLSELVQMISLNLFIPNATKTYIPPMKVKTGAGRFACEPTDVPRSCWHHRAQVYTIILHLICCYNGGEGPEMVSTQEPNSGFHEAFREHINFHFVSHLMKALQTSDLLERETIVACFILMSGQCPYLKDIIWKRTEMAFHEFTSDGVWDVEVASTQVLSLIGFVDNLKNTDVSLQFIETCLLPLYKAPFEVLVRYHPALLKFMIKLIHSDHNLIKSVIKRLLYCWPLANASKQLLFLEQMSAIFLEVVVRKGQAANRPEENIPPQKQWVYAKEDHDVFMELHETLFARVCWCLEGEHYEVSVAAIRILDHPAVFFPFLLEPDVLKAETKPDGTKAARIHPVLNVIYRSFRRVVANHDYIEVRKTIHTLMGLLEEKWGDVCEQEIIEEDARQVLRDKRREDMDTVFEQCHKKRAQRHERVVSSHHLSARHLDVESAEDLEGFEHLRARGGSVSTLNISSNPSNTKRKSLLLTKEKNRRSSILLSSPRASKTDVESDSATIVEGFESTPPTSRRRRDSFELEEEKQSALAQVPEAAEEKDDVDKDLDDSEKGERAAGDGDSDDDDEKEDKEDAACYEVDEDDVVEEAKKHVNRESLDEHGLSLALHRMSFMAGT